MEFRKIFDAIPEKFDKWRPHYCDKAFQCLIQNTQLNFQKAVLEIGPGTGQATSRSWKQAAIIWQSNWEKI